ncbi:MAG: hypothetical protein JXB03_02910 [Spirochaetales bacterium]|nr:hypothetical protein [Spirochaetales bacterium]
MKRTILFLIVSLVLLMLFGGCSLFGGFGSGDEKLYSAQEVVSLSPGSEDIQYDEIPLSGSSGSLKTLALGDTPRDTYILFSNLEDNSVFEASPKNGTEAVSVKERIARYNAQAVSDSAKNRGIVVGSGSAEKVYSRASGDLDESSGGEPSITGDDIRFWEAITEETPREIPATCRKVVVKNDGSQGLSVWVANESFTEDDETGKINQTMVDALAASFLDPSEDRIYEWVTDIYGEEWGSHDFPQELLSAYDTDIDGTLVDESTGPGWVTVLLYDISGDGFPKPNEGRIYGYFHGLHNLIRLENSYSLQDYSAERVMISLDAPIFAQKDSDSAQWNVSDYYPSEIISTLAHEFQHLVFFYRKNVTFNIDTAIWLNEMLSLMTEDLLSDRLGVPGPRGVNPLDGTSGEEGNFLGRLPFYNAYPDDSLVDWGELPYDQYQSYSTAYSFGAFLGRNYDGARLFRAIQNSPYGDYRAVEDGLQAVEAFHAPDSVYAGIGSLSFNDIVVRWGVANLVSDTVQLSPGLALNKGTTDDGWFTDSLGYRLGSIDLSKYYRASTNTQSLLTGLRVYSNKYDFPEIVGDYGHIYYHVGDNISGILPLDFSVPSTFRATLIRRR